MIEDLILRGDFERATDRLMELEFGCPDQPLRFAAAMVQARLFELSDKRTTSVRLLERFKLREPNQQTDVRTSLEHEQIRLYLFDRQFQSASNLSKGSDFEAQVEMDSRIFIDLESKLPSPILYGGASLIPGLGQVLLGEPLSAVSSLLMIAIPTAFALVAAKNNEVAFEIASWTLSGFFYLGNISSAYRKASIKNSNVLNQRWEEHLEKNRISRTSGAMKRAGFSDTAVRHLFPDAPISNLE